MIVSDKYCAIDLQTFQSETAFIISPRESWLTSCFEYWDSDKNIQTLIYFDASIRKNFRTLFFTNTDQRFSNTVERT